MAKGTSICPHCDYIIDASFLSNEPPEPDDVESEPAAPSERTVVGPAPTAPPERSAPRRPSAPGARPVAKPVERRPASERIRTEDKSRDAEADAEPSLVEPEPLEDGSFVRNRDDLGPPRLNATADGVVRKSRPDLVGRGEGTDGKGRDALRPRRATDAAQPARRREAAAPDLDSTEPSSGDDVRPVRRATGADLPAQRRDDARPVRRATGADLPAQSRDADDADDSSLSGSNLRPPRRVTDGAMPVARSVEVRGDEPQHDPNATRVKSVADIEAEHTSRPRPRSGARPPTRSGARTPARPAEEVDADADPRLATHPQPEADPTGRPPSDVFKPDEALNDIKQYVSDLSTSDKLTFAGTVGVLLSAVLPWQENAQEGDIMGVASLGILAVLAAALTLGALVIRTRDMLPRVGPVIPWLVQLASSAFGSLWCLVFLRLAYDSHKVVGTLGEEMVAASTPSGGALFGLLFSILALGGTLMGLREKR